MLNFTNEALRVISDYIKEFRRALWQFQFELELLYEQVLSSELEDAIKFHSIKYSRKRGAKRVEVDDVNSVLKKFGRPMELLENIKGSSLIFFKNLKFMREALEKSKKFMVLDAGCGWGRYLKRLQTQNIKNLEMVGVDLDSIALHYGKTVNKQANFLKSDIEVLPFRGQVFNLILCNGVIHEIKTLRGREK